MSCAICGVNDTHRWHWVNNVVCTTENNSGEITEFKVPIEYCDKCFNKLSDEEKGKEVNL